jgi:hypothetical protein
MNHYYASPDIQKYYEVTRRKLLSDESDGLGQPERVIPELYKVFTHFLQRIEALEAQVAELKANQPVQVTDAVAKRGIFR